MKNKRNISPFMTLFVFHIQCLICKVPDLYSITVIMSSCFKHFIYVGEKTLHSKGLMIKSFNNIKKFITQQKKNSKYEVMFLGSQHGQERKLEFWFETLQSFELWLSKRTWKAIHSAHRNEIKLFMKRNKAECFYSKQVTSPH